jgi:hemoglobin/transferrin/lactoferrin receptor protein
MRLARPVAAVTTFSLVTLATATATNAQSPPRPAGPALDEITVTATRQEERAIEALAAVSITTRQDLRQRQDARIGDALRAVPGVATIENPNDPATSVNIRGLQDFGRVAVTVDGARQNFQRSGHNANGAFFLDPAFVRAIDVTRGPVANIYGSGAIGGIVSFITIDPSDILRSGERVAAEVSGTMAFGAQSGAVGTAIGAFRTPFHVEGLAGVSFRRNDDFKDGNGRVVEDSASSIRSGIARLVFDPGNGHRLSVGGQLQRFLFVNGPGSPASPRRENDVETTNLNARYRYSSPDNPWLDITASAYRTTTETTQVRVSGTPAQVGQSRFFNIRTQGFDAHNTSRVDVGPGRLSLTLGGDLFEDRVATFDPFGNGDESTPSGKRSVGGAFAQASYRVGMFDAIAAIRYDTYRLSGGATSSSGQRFSPKFTLGITPIRGLQFYGTYAEGYRAPAVTETLVAGLHPAPALFRFIPNPNLRPEIGRTIEAGLNLRYDDLLSQGDRLRGKLSIFRNDVSNFIEGVYRDNPPICGTPPVAVSCADATFRYENVASARIQGLEGEFVYDARAWFALVSGSTTRGDDRQRNAPLRSVNPDRVSIGGGVRFLDEALTLGARVNFVAAQRRLPADATDLATPAHATVDLFGNYRVNQDTQAYFTVTNIGDRSYRIYNSSIASGARAPGLTARFGLTLRFGG